MIRALVGNKISDHSDVVGASPVGAASASRAVSGLLCIVAAGHYPYLLSYFIGIRAIIRSP